jgi:hypothetical protein
MEVTDMKYSRSEWLLIAAVFALCVAANLPAALQAMLPVSHSAVQTALAALLAFVLVRYVPLSIVIALSMLLVGSGIPWLLGEYYQVSYWLILLLTGLILLFTLAYRALRVDEDESVPQASAAQNVQTLFRVVERGNLAWTQRLIAMGADVDVRNDAGQTPLMFAAEKGYADMVQVLIQNGANPRLENNQGESALTIALMKGYTRIAESLEMAEASHRYTQKTGGDRT